LKNNNGCGFISANKWEHPRCTINSNAINNFGKRTQKQRTGL
jgi:hypothetical protein